VTVSKRKPPSLHPWEGTAYRATTHDVPLWVRPNRRDGRWNVAGLDCTQYLALDADAPYAETIRHRELETEEEVAQVRIQLWEVRLHEAAIVDYRTFELAEAAGFPPEALVDDDHDRCQSEAQWLKHNKARGVLTPSAALPGAVNLTLFGPRVEVSWTTSTKLSSEVPGRRVGGKGSPPVGMLEQVRQYGTLHSGLEEYRAAVAARVKRPPASSS
jgi:RES domain-containing protein